MGKLPYYKTLQEKAGFFFKGSKRVNTKKEFDRFWERLRDLDGKGIYRFRGCSEAKYKLYTSAQRYWNEREIKKQRIKYHEFIQRLIAHSMQWNHETVQRFFAQNNINLNNALAYLSYMQHYGMPTPLLDFTTNPYSGLYFAVKNPIFAPSDRDIDSYCSLYIVSTVNPFFADSISQFDRDIAVQPDGAIEYERHLLSHSILFVSTGNSAYKILNNLNILNQEGVFFFSSNAEMPIEAAYKEAMLDFQNSLGADLFAQYGYQEFFAECINFHKSLRPYILAKLKTENITSDFLFPDIEKFSESVLSLVLSEHRD
ncbi:MAG: FRG domain-containing protein [Saprospirales bacterium]|jgi:hypothetical protein|nr:FRG domain-containing protein [Saprospirales bacterium]MBK8923609.1 FRG domain-containing protein [Saprospirales bacterium]